MPILIVTSLLIKIVFAFLPPFAVDMSAWLAWAQRLAAFGPANFYSDSVWTQYTPGFLYWLLLIGKLNLTSHWLIKLPSLLADFLTAFLIWKITRSRLLPFLYLLNPVTIFISSVWGQIDSLLTLFLLLSLYLLLKSRLSLSWLSWSVAFLLKPQAMALLPVLLVISLQRYRFTALIRTLLITLITILLTSLPFFLQNPFLGLPQLILKMGQHYHFTSLNAFNFWQLVTGLWQDDTLYVYLGLGLYLLALLLIFFSPKIKANHYLLAALSLFAFFFFPTRVHERYLFPFFAFFLAARPSLKLFSLISVTYFLNLYYSYALYSDNFFRLPDFINPLIALVLLAFFFFFLIPRRPLILLLAFSLILRLFRLSTPPEFYFDEVYHAFTAREMLVGNPQAWEWWNPNPPGVAYEWTHPPLAKHFMVLGMQLFGPNAFGWRFFSVIFGTANIFLVYLLARKFFNHRTGLIAAALYSLETLTFVQSRIAMNDTYMIFFMLLCIYAFILRRYPAAALSFGLALATKWSAIYLFPVLFLVLIISKLKFRNCLKIGAWFLVIPLAVYLASYLPFFITRHSWAQFIELQRQMYWYHTRLNATHAYSSPWWSWPLMLRPVWYYVKYFPASIANIYALANPVILWSGLIAIISSLFMIHNSLFIILAGYASFLLPWAFSPRIMFLYHYLPSIPFLVIILANFLSRHKLLAISYLLLAGSVFALLYPHLTALPVSKLWANLYYLIPSWK